ncbi:MAG: methylamine utilization protein [Chlorobi bacterium]|nr:methylamine utilization protein [Chlorobiota bacterium]
MQAVVVLCVCTLVFTIGCDHAEAPQDVVVSEYPVPSGFPPISTPRDNLITDAKISLGRLLFYDAQLSRDGDLSCSSCHQQARAFSDTISVSRGTQSEIGLRNAPPIINAAYSRSWFWDGRARSLEEQIIGALTSPIEMASDTALIAERLSQSPNYRNAFTQAFGTSPSARDAVRAIATFCRVLLSGNSRFDRYSRGDSSALSDAEKRGMALFFSARTHCSECHGGVFFSDFDFHSIGIHSHYYDRGRYYVTGNEHDIGKFKTPTLRNIALTAPYMNDGTLTTLDQVLQHYNSGGKPFINKDPRIRPLGLTSAELDDLRAFLHTLTDSMFITNPILAKP